MLHDFTLLLSVKKTNIGLLHMRNVLLDNEKNTVFCLIT